MLCLRLVFCTLTTIVSFTFGSYAITPMSCRRHSVRLNPALLLALSLPLPDSCAVKLLANMRQANRSTRTLYSQVHVNDDSLPFDDLVADLVHIIQFESPKDGESPKGSWVQIRSIEVCMAETR